MTTVERREHTYEVMANDMSEGMRFFAQLGNLNAENCVDGAEKAQCAALWHATDWYRNTRLGSSITSNNITIPDEFEENGQPQN